MPAGPRRRISIRLRHLPLPFALRPSIHGLLALDYKIRRGAVRHIENIPGAGSAGASPIYDAEGDVALEMQGQMLAK